MNRNTIIFIVLVPAISQAQVVFLDNRSGIINGSTTYDPETRTCGEGSYLVFTDLDQAAQALSSADVLYIRAGTYSRASVGDYTVVHGNKVNYWTGALDITASGTDHKHKLVTAYKGEPVVIQAKQGASRYNPDPRDTTFKKSSHFYPNPAIGVHGAYVDVIGLKTYGQVVISGHDITLHGCDLGGGGPHMNQGQVIALNGTGGSGVYNVLISDNKIYHSTWGESTRNGAAVMGYNASYVIENNEFYDNYGPDICTKDTGGQQGRNIEIKYNFFGPSSLMRNAGVNFHNQDAQVDWIYVHHNVFLNKASGIAWSAPGRRGAVVYNNTFVNCGFGSGEVGDIGTWQNHEINAFNNIYYHSKREQVFYHLQTEPWSKLNSDFNLFYSTTEETSWWHRYRPCGTTLIAWQRYSGKDKNSVWKDPQFVNPAGSRPEDFKRGGDPKQITDVAEGKYGPVCGAYVTGDEVIGVHVEAVGAQTAVDRWQLMKWVQIGHVVRD